jgi:lysophospholipase L1-like esterase
MHKSVLLTVCLVMSLPLFGCESDAPPTMMGPTMGTAGTSMATNGMACAQTPVDPTFARNLCNNPQDKCLETTNSAKIRTISGACATGKLKPSSGDNCGLYVSDPMGAKAVSCFKQCATEQTTAQIGGTLSDACWSCPDEVVVCGAKYCVANCFNDPQAPDCVACLCAQHADALGPGKAGNCLQDVFAQCAGYRPSAEAVGCTAATGAAGMMSTGVAGSTPVAGRNAAGTNAAGSMAAGSPAAGGGGMSTAGTGMGGASGSAGTGTSGMGAAGASGGPAAGGGGTGGTAPTDTFKRPCLDSGNEVVFIGDSYSNYAVAHSALAALVADRAQDDGALMAGARYRDLAVAGTTLAAANVIGMIPPQWDDAKRMKPIKAVVMDGGGNDVLIAHRECLADGSEQQPGCMSVVNDSVMAAKKLLEDMKATGVSDVIYFWYPHLPAMLGGNGNSISDYAFPLLEALAKEVSTDTFHVFMVDTVPIFEGHPEYFFSDNIHANDTGEGKIADAVYKVMKDNCIAQPESKGCCMP